MDHCNFYFKGSVSKVTRLLAFMIIFKVNSIAYNMKRHKHWFRYHAQLPLKMRKKSDLFILACKCVRIYLHASLSGGQHKAG